MNAHAEFNAPALLRRLSDIVDEYELKLSEVVQTVANFKKVVSAAENSASIGGEFGAPIWGRSSPSLYARDLEKALLISAWKHVYNGLNIKRVAPATERKRFELQLENPPEFSIDNIRATFGKYLIDPRQHILRGLAEVFCELDSAYKSHSKVKIGVDGLPKRIILSGFGEYSYGSYGQEKLLDVLNALANYRGEPQLHAGHISDMVRTARADGSCMWWGGELRVFKNGNGHLIFDRHALREINLALAEFYGEALYDDTCDDDEAGPLFSSTEVAKDLQFFPTPQAVADALFAHIELTEPYGETPPPLEVLEPSCGEGNLILALQSAEVQSHSRKRALRITGVEHDAERAKIARSKGCNVLRTNFLETVPDPRFDLVLMNPPFNRWRRHLAHARKFLKPSGKLICILPAVAFYDGHLGKLGYVAEDAHEWERGWRDTGWNDLPVGSFSESGTNVPTGFLICRAYRGEL